MLRVAASLVVLAVTGCNPGDTPAGDTTPAGQDGTITFRDIGGPDLPAPDLSSDTTRDAARSDADGNLPLDMQKPKLDAPPAGDSSVDGKGGPGCVDWPAWQCTAGAFFPCSASCTDTSSRQITCNSAGQCSCVKNGQAESCNSVPLATGCSVCQAAMLGGCCAGD
ncbi:MAG: hypothetical protein KC503_22600 [Myxococcales bacterium]|nr:hypothetical protein [Myxococcales bacterium]